MVDPIFGSLIDPKIRQSLHKEAVEGVHHFHRRDPLDPSPGQPINLLLSTGGPVPYDSARCAYSVDGTDPGAHPGYMLDMHPAGVHWDDPTWSLVTTWRATLPAQPTRTLIRYRLYAHRTGSDNWIEPDQVPGKPPECFSLWVDDDPAPAWAREALVYQIFPDRFHPGSSKPWNQVSSLTDFYGGTLQGITEKLNYIKELGFNTIWLNPFFISSSHHGYNASDYYQVEPRLGSMADLKELIGQAHSHGLRLILDFVANHWSREHPTFQDAIQRPDSPYHDWYSWKDWPDEYDCYFNVRELPKINLADPQARAYMLDVARHWLREGFDGYRLDFAYGPSHEFWVDFRRACREVNPECWIFGEVVQTAELLRSYTGIMDGTLDFFLARALRECFALERMSLAGFESFLAAHEQYFPEGLMRPSFLDNHDEERFLHLAGNDKACLRLAAIIQYTLSGPPIVYYGTETGLSQERPMLQHGHNVFEECRLPMNWSTVDANLQDFYRHLNHLRRDHPVLVHGSRRVIHLNSEEGTYAYLRGEGKTSVMVAINTSMTTKTITVTNPGFMDGKDHLHTCQVEKQGTTLVITLPTQSGAFIC